jgi:hypothetical protein
MFNLSNKILKCRPQWKHDALRKVIRRRGPHNEDAGTSMFFRRTQQTERHAIYEGDATKTYIGVAVYTRSLTLIQDGGKLSSLPLGKGRTPRIH